MRRLSTLRLFGMMFCLGSAFAMAYAGDDHTGQFEPNLIADKEDFESVILKPVLREKIQGKMTFSDSAHLAAGRIMDPRTQNYTILTLLVEQRGELPMVYVDLDGDNTLGEDEKYVLKPSDSDDPYIWQTTAELKMK